jgi:hypothetical protein
LKAGGKNSLKNTTKIVCPKCNAVAKLSLVDNSYVGPRKCWKCHEYFTITIENNLVTSCEPLSQEEYERRYPTKKAAEKAQLIFDFSPKQEETDVPPVAQEKPLKYAKPFIPQEPAGRSESGNPVLFPPDRPRTFIPLEEADEKPGKSPKSKNPLEKQRDGTGPAGIFPPDRPRTFIPLEANDEKPGKR